MMRRFWLKLALFLLPLMLACSVPLATMLLSGELLSPDTLAKKHAAAAIDALYGPAYTNPDKRYKLTSLLIHDAPVMAIGTSRVMEFRSEFFEGGESTFYNAGGLVSRLSHMRRAVAHIPTTTRMRFLIVGFDQWSYNDNWEGSADDPGVEADYADSSDALANLRRGMLAWPDYVNGRLPIRKLLGPTDNLGVNARLRGNGFRRDGSYLYGEILRNPTLATDYQFKDTLARLSSGSRRLERGNTVSARALEETHAFLEECRSRNISVVGFMPPFAPTVIDRLRESPDHRYIEELPARLREVFARSSVPLFDFSSCAALGCTDAEFIDGFHGGDVVYARLVLEMAQTVPWLETKLSPALRDRMLRAAGRPAL